ncbi:MAG: N-acetylneuraminate synthase family protein [Candidatus Omnitrophota bacterium]|nr:N-acetylneuraminate synthase family protein [Candidatus Omnitrophota bacterium]
MKTTPAFQIRDKQVGAGHPCYLIAEIGNNHHGSPDAAKALIQAAADAGADAVKFQTFKAEDIVSHELPANAFPGFDVSDRFEKWIDYVRTTELAYEAYDDLIREAHAQGVAFLSTPASVEALQLLVDKQADAIKIASMDLNNLPFLRRVAQTGRPVILSTGMSTLEEIREAVQALGRLPLALLHCVSTYPLQYENANLLNISTLQDTFAVPVGFSNHALGYDLDIAAVVLGARLIEKHFTLNRKHPEMAEHHFSMEPDEFADLVSRVRTMERALGSRSRTLTPEEQRNRSLARRSVTVTRDLQAKDVLTAKDLVLLRPGTGIEPKHLNDVIGKRLGRTLKAFQPLAWDDLER